MIPGPYPVVGSTSIIGRHAEYKVHPPGVVTGRSGSLGEVQFIDQPFWPHNTSLWVKDFKGNDPRYVYYALQRLNFARFNAGAGVPTLNRNHLDTLEIDPPKPTEQKRIAGVLSAYDDLIENNRRQIKILEEMARTLYREWFVLFRHPSDANVELIESRAGQIPKTWKATPLKELADITYGFAFKSQRFNTEGIGEPIVRIRDIPKGKSETYTDETADPKFAINDSDILIGMDGDFHMTVWAGGPAMQVQRVAKLRPKAAIGTKHLFLAIEGPIQELNRSIVGTTVAHLGDSHLSTIHLRQAPECLMQDAKLKLDAFSDQVITLKKQIENLRSTRDLLLPRLIPGDC